MEPRVDSVTLTAVIEKCLDFSMDGRLTQEHRSAFLTVAKRLRGLLLNLLSARFDKDTPDLLDSNAELARINRQLKKKTDTLAKAAETLADLAKVVGSLDKLLGVAKVFL